MDGFLSNNVYEQFAQSNVKVDQYLDCSDTTDRIALLGNRTNKFATD